VITPYELLESIPGDLRGGEFLLTIDRNYNNAHSDDQRRTISSTGVGAARVRISTRRPLLAADIRNFDNEPTLKARDNDLTPTASWPPLARPNEAGGRYDARCLPDLTVVGDFLVQ
jgi:hypothetical protein